MVFAGMVLCQVHESHSVHNTRLNDWWKEKGAFGSGGHCCLARGSAFTVVFLLLAERRTAISTLDYALASGADGAASSKTEVEAAMKRTGEEVGVHNNTPVSCAAS